MTERTRETIVLSYGTASGPDRNITVPEPLDGLTAPTVIWAAEQLAAANPLNTPLTELKRAVVVKQTTRKLFG